MECVVDVSGSTQDVGYAIKCIALRLLIIHCNNVMNVVEGLSHMYMSPSPALSCRSLSNPINGRVIWTNLTVGGVATYVCDDAYELVGNMTRICQGYDTWSQEEPVCSGMLITPPFICSHWVYRVQTSRQFIVLTKINVLLV